mmetsp:Transcript_32663/g.73432  ORF Transcript_32663/g.73432 Transcript_32663/m.73432 type:complete len:239 (-) Transcript_32663:73-789(-)
MLVLFLRVLLLLLRNPLQVLLCKLLPLLLLLLLQGQQLDSPLFHFLQRFHSNLQLQLCLLHPLPLLLLQPFFRHPPSLCLLLSLPVQLFLPPTDFFFLRHKLLPLLLSPLLLLLLHLRLPPPQTLLLLLLPPKLCHLPFRLQPSQLCQSRSLLLLPLLLLFVLYVNLLLNGQLQAPPLLLCLHDRLHLLLILHPPLVHLQLELVLSFLSQLSDEPLQMCRPVESGARGERRGAPSADG